MAFAICFLSPVCCWFLKFRSTAQPVLLAIINSFKFAACWLRTQRSEATTFILDPDWVVTWPGPKARYKSSIKNKMFEENSMRSRRRTAEASSPATGTMKDATSARYAFLKKEKNKKSYFSTEKIKDLTCGQWHNRDEMPSKTSICAYVAPTKASGTKRNHA